MTTDAKTDDLLEQFFTLNERLEKEFGHFCFYPEKFLPHPAGNYLNLFFLYYAAAIKNNQATEEFKRAIAINIGNLYKFRKDLDAVHHLKTNQTMQKLQSVEGITPEELKQKLANWSHPNPEWFKKDEELFKEYIDDLISACDSFKLSKETMYEHNAHFFMGDYYESAKLRFTSSLNNAVVAKPPIKPAYEDYDPQPKEMSKTTYYTFNLILLAIGWFVIYQYVIKQA